MIAVQPDIIPTGSLLRILEGEEAEWNIVADKFAAFDLTEGIGSLEAEMEFGNSDFRDVVAAKLQQLNERYRSLQLRHS